MNVALFAQRAVTTATLVLALLLAVAGRGNARYIALAELNPRTRVAEFGLASTGTRIAALEHNTAMADLLFLQALSEFGKHYGSIDAANWMVEYLHTIILLDPGFELAYEWGGTVAMYDGSIDQAGVVVSNEILLDGIERFPTSWRLHFMLAVNYLLEYQAVDEEDRNVHQRLGAEYLLLASQMPEAPDDLVVTALSFMRRIATIGAAHLSSMRRLAWGTGAESNYATAQYQAERSSPPAFSAIVNVDQQVSDLLDAPPATFALGQRDFLLVVHPDPVYLDVVERTGE